MQTYVVNERKRKKALKRMAKDNRKTLKTFPRICYYLTVVLKITAIVCGTANVLYMFFVSHSWSETILLMITFIAPYGLSFLPQTVYFVSLNREFRFRCRETITFKPDGFIYSYHDDRVSAYDSIFAYDIKYSQIERFERDERTMVLTFYGHFVTDTYSGEKITQTLECRVFDFMDVYDVDIQQILKQNMKNGVEK